MVKRFLKPRAWLGFLHLWVALLLGAAVLLMVVTGSLLLFRPELEPLIYPQLYKVSSGAPVSLVNVLEAVKAAYPTAQVESLELPPMTHGAIRAVVSGADFKGDVFVDPNSGAINGVQAKHSSLFDWLLSLHKELLQRPETLAIENNYGHGHVLVGYIGFVFLFLLLTGLVLWFPKIKAWKQAFQLRRKNRFVWNYDSHRLVGIAVLIPLMASVSIILPYTFYGQSRNLLHAIGLPQTPEPERRFSFESQPLTLDGIVKKAEAFEAGAKAVSVSLDSSPILVRLSTVNDSSRNTGKYQGDLTLGISENSGAITSVQDTRQWPLGARVVDSSLYMGVHAGTWGGWVTRVLTLLAALGTMYLAWSGTRQWWIKRGIRRAARQKARA